MRATSTSAAWTALLLLVAPARGQPITLQNASATFSQAGFPVGGTIDGNTATGSWAVSGSGGAGNTSSQTAVWETQANVGSAGGTLFTFQLLHTQIGVALGHNLGRFRLSVTTDDRSIFADGLASGGDVTATWVVLDPLTSVSDTGESFTKQGDLSLLVSGGTNTQSTYTVTAAASVSGITGFRLEALEDPSLPFGGPGRQPINGNFHLSEFTVAVAPVPEPSALALAGAAAGLAVRRFRRRGVSPAGLRSVA
jgi:hypothetical protein